MGPAALFTLKAKSARRGGIWLAAQALLAFAAMVTIGSPAEAGVAHPDLDAPISTSVPSGFDALLGSQSTVVDVYYGGRRVGVAMASYSPGIIRFANADAVLAMIPRLIRPLALKALLASDMSTHAERACDEETNGRCRHLTPEIVGVIFDEARFRADLFVNPAYLDATTVIASRYIPKPDPSPSLAASLGGVLSGSVNSGSSYGLQSHVVAAYGDTHLDAEVSQSSTVGFQVQTIEAVVDHGPLRGQVGLLMSPGVDLIGQGRFYGAAIGTQTDTLANRDQISSSPILLYLTNNAQVDILRNGRLLASKQYEAGNQLIDTSTLPDGAYTITLHIRETGGYTHDETRSFNKSRALPPIGLPQFFFGGGVLAKDYAMGFPSTTDMLIEAGYARRLAPSMAIDLTGALVGRRALGEAGFTYFSANGLRFRAASIAASDGGFGLLLSSAFNIGQWSVLNFDVRQGWGSRHPQTSGTGSATMLGQNFQQNEFGLGLSGTQASASYMVTWRGAQFGLVGAYSGALGAKSSHTFGPTVDIPLRVSGVDLRFIGNTSYTEHGVQAFFGFRLQFNRGRTNAYGDVGISSTVNEAGRRELSPTVDLSGSINRTDEHWGDATGSATYSHMQDRDAVTAQGQVRGDRGDFTAEVDRDLSGPGADTHYSAGFMIGGAITPYRAAVGSSSGGDSGVIVNVTGAPKGSQFEVLVNNAPRARISAGESLPIMLPAYRVYSIRLAPRGGAVSDFDTSARDVSLYPGTVRTLTWKAEKIVEVFGRAMDENDHPVAQAAIQGGRYPGLTDDNGYFQVEVSQNARLRFTRSREAACEIAVAGVDNVTSHMSVGVRKCYALTVASGEGTMKTAMAANTEGQ